MRPKILLSVLPVAFALLALLALFRPEPHKITPDPAVTDAPSQSRPSGAEVAASEPSAAVSAKSPHAIAPALPSTLAKEQRPDDESISKRAEELSRLAMQSDPGSLATILSALDDPEPQIRSAALQASIQFGSRDAIPKLAEEAANAEDPQTRRAFEQAVEYLKLPSLTEVLAEQRRAGNP
jgi:HEAT repeat protein